MERIPDIIFDEKAATASLHRKHRPTNPLYNAFGEARGEIKRYLKNLKGEALRSRRQWLVLNEGNTMPHGPYPVMVRNHGWMQVFLHDAHYQASYLARGDLNLDVQMYRYEFDKAGQITEKFIIGPDTKVPVTLSYSRKVQPQIGAFQHLLRK